jgi:prepilin-type N-terminal cleavage/methylation domain-containing protein
MKKKQWGFTLIELIVVIGIMTTLSGGVIYSFSKLQKDSVLETGLTNIGTTLTLARDAVRKGSCKDMLVTVGVVSSDDSATEVTAKCQDPGSAIQILPAQISRDISFQINTKNPPETFHFVSYGLGGLAIAQSNPINFSETDLVITLGKSSETKTLTLSQMALLYQPFQTGEN